MELNLINKNIMRDINRIKPTLKKIEDLWLSNPDLRFGQLVVNIFRAEEQNPKIFYAEDDVLLEKLNEFQDFLENKNDFIK
jgi:hypothetical protein